MKYLTLIFILLFSFSAFGQNGIGQFYRENASIVRSLSETREEFKKDEFETREEFRERISKKLTPIWITIKPCLEYDAEN